MVIIVYHVLNTVLIVIYQMEDASNVLYLSLLKTMVHVVVKLVLFITRLLQSAAPVYKTVMYVSIIKHVRHVPMDMN